MSSTAIIGGLDSAKIGGVFIICIKIWKERGAWEKLWTLLRENSDVWNPLAMLRLQRKGVNLDAQIAIKAPVKCLSQSAPVNVNRAADR